MTCAFATAQELRFEPAPGDHRTREQFQADCKAGIALSTCYKPGIAPDCPPGKHWTKMGGNIPHCVLDDMDCALGKKLEHDKYGNPSCAPIVCKDKQLLVNNVCVDQFQPVINPVTLDFDGLSFGGYPYPDYAVSGINIPNGRFVSKMHMILNTNDGTWAYGSTYPIHPEGCCRPITTPKSGRWTNAPAQPYQYRVVSMTYGPYSWGLPHPIGSVFNAEDHKHQWIGVTTHPLGPTDWTTLPANSRVSISGINMDLINGCSYVGGSSVSLDIKFKIQIRPSLSPADVSEASFDFVFRPITTNIDCTPMG